MDLEVYTEMLKVLADGNRVRILKLLQNKTLCGCDILEELDISQSTLSHHMKKLCKIGLVRCHKEGKWQYYHINKIVGDDFIACTQELLQTKSEEVQAHD